MSEKGRHSVDPTVFVHETAVVDEDVIVGAKTKIWHFTHVLGHSRIGAN